MKLVRLYPNMTPEQMTLVRNAEFSGMLDIKCCKLEPELCKFLMESFNPVTCEMVFPGRGSITVMEDSVYNVLGVPWGDKEVRYEIDADAIKFMAKQFGHTGKIQPMMTTLEDKLIAMDNADNTYLRCWATFCMCYVLAPTTIIHVSPRIYPSLINIKEVNKLNVPKFVIKMLRKAAKSRPEKAVQKACMLYMMVMYVDSLALNNIDVSKHGTWASVWTNSMVKQAIVQDSFEDGSFGRASLKEEFRIQDTQPDSTEDVSNSKRTEYHSVSKGSVDQSGSDEDEVEAVKKGNEGKNDSEKIELEAVKKDSEGMNESDENEVEAVKEDTEGKNESEESQIQANTEETKCQRGNNDTTSGADARQSTLFPDKEVFASFLATHAPADCTSDDKANLTKAIGDSCYDFEASLQKLIKTITHKSEAPSYISKRRPRQPVANRRKTKIRCPDEEQTPAPTSVKSESVRPADTDYLLDEEEHERTESYLSLDDESYDIKGNSEAKDERKHNLRTRKRKRIISQRDLGTPSNATPATSSDKNTFQDMPSEENTISSPATATSPLLSEKSDTDFTEPTTHKHLRSKEEQGSHLIPEVNAVEYKDKVALDLNEPAVDTTDVKRGHEECEDTYVTNADGLRQMQTEIPMANKPEAIIAKENVDQHETVHDCKVPGFPCSKTVEKQVGNKNASHIETFKVADNLTALGETYSSSSNSINQDSISEDTNLDPTHVYAEWHNKMNLHACVAYSPPKKFEVPQFETPTMIDLEMYKTSSLCSGMVKLMGEMEQSNEGLQSYFSGSPREELKKILYEMEPKTKSSKQKSVSFADGANQRQQHVSGGVPTPSTYRTRSVTRVTMAENTIIPNSKLLRKSPRRAVTQDNTVGTEDQPIDLTQQRVTSSSVKSARANTSTEKSPSEQIVEVGLPNQTTPDSMVRRLSFSSAMSIEKKERIDAAPDAPSFDIGFDTQEEQIKETKEDGNEENVPAILQPACVEDGAGPSGASITPVPNEYQKRIIKPGKFDRSPYIPDNKKYLSVTRGANELYNMFIKHGWESRSKVKKEPIIDIGTNFVILADLADSVAPGKQLVNFVADIAIHIIDAENKNKKKFIMPLRIATYLLDCRFKLKDVKRVFCASTTHRLDHKELICFPTLRSFAHQPKFDKDSGNYWLVNLNIKAARFEIMDSLTRNGEPLMMDTCHCLIASIKTMWKAEYSTSRVDISNYPIDVLPVPKQTTIFDCGFFMLRLLEEWQGRRVEMFDQKELPNMRKVLNEKWVRWPQNQVQWEFIL